MEEAKGNIILRHRGFDYNIEVNLNNSMEEIVKQVNEHFTLLDLPYTAKIILETNDNRIKR